MSRLPKTISVEKLDNSVLFTFAQNQHYLYDGTIEVPFNSLSIIADKSEAITLRKSASNDIFISAPWENFDINASSKEDVVDALTDMLYDETGGGVSREEVEDMIDAATSGIPSSQVIEQLRTDVNTISGDVQSLQDDVNSVWDTIDEKEEVVASALTELNLRVTEDEEVIEQLRTDVNTISGDVNSVWDTIDEKEEVVASALTELNLRVTEDEEVTAAALNDLNDRIGSGGGALFVNFDDLMNNMNDDKWDELVNALQNNKPIFAIHNGSEGDITDAGQSPVDGYVYIDEGQESTKIGLKQLYGGGYRELYIVKNGSEDYEVTDNSFDYQPMLQAGSGISIDENNVISVTVDSELDETSNNPVANSAVTTVIIDDEEVISRAINELNDRLVAVESGGSSVTVDTSLDSGSTNPVANSAITVALDGKADTSAITTAITSASTNDEVAGAKAVYDAIQAGGGGGVTVDSTLDTGSTNPVANSAITTAINAKQDALYLYTENNNLGTAELHSNDSSLIFNAGGASITAMGVNTFNVKATGVTINGDKVLTESDITSAITSGSTDAQVPSAKATFDALDAKADASTTYTKTEVNNLVNNKFWCGTQAQYDAITTKENDVLYLIHN